MAPVERNDSVGEGGTLCSKERRSANGNENQSGSLAGVDFRSNIMRPEFEFDAIRLWTESGLTYAVRNFEECGWCAAAP